MSWGKEVNYLKFSIAFTSNNLQINILCLE